MEELDASPSEDSGFMAKFLNRIKRWLLTHSQHLNFFTVFVLASVSISMSCPDWELRTVIYTYTVVLQVPNPLFDLAGIMCGQFGIPFWEFFLATLIGKAIIKTHIQVWNLIFLIFFYLSGPLS